MKVSRSGCVTYSLECPLQVQVSDGTSYEPFSRISEADLEISRHRIASFLSMHMAHELLPESGKVWIIYPWLPFRHLLLLMFLCPWVNSILVFNDLVALGFAGHCFGC